MVMTGEYISKYQIKGVIGKGGMATVYRAYDRGFERDVALKVMSESDRGENDRSKSEEVERFLRGARLSAKVKHPNVVTMYEVGSDDKGNCFIAMELIEGETLEAKLREKGVYGVDEALEIVIVVCAALSEAHRQGVVHRDIKPDNILIDKKGHIYVSDFGIARSLFKSGTSKTQLMGAPSYMSPERCAGHSGDARSDLYALGIVMYEMLTGSPPFIGEPATVVLKQVSEEPAPPRSRNSQIPVWLNSVVMRLLAKNPDSRFQSCGELVGALRERITVTIPRPPMSQTSRKWLLIGLQGVAAVIVGVAVVVWYDKPNPVPPPPTPISAEERHEKAEDWVSKAKEYEKINEYIEAKHAYSKALKDEPENREAKAGSERCKEILDKESKRIGEEKARKDEASNYVKNGRESEKTGNYAKAKDAYSKALELEPENSDAVAGIRRCESKEADAKQIKEKLAKNVGTRITLRSKPLKEYLDYEAVKSMLKEKGFFDVYTNTSASGFSNDFVLESEGKVVYDSNTGLRWQQSGSKEHMPPVAAKEYINKLNRDKYAGYSDWRLPTLEEAMSLMEPTHMNGDLYIDPKFDKSQRWIWTSDPYSASSAWVVNFSNGYCLTNGFCSNYVRAVR